jgi:carbamoylphosphate synthase large subunit
MKSVGEAMAIGRTFKESCKRPALAGDRPLAAWAATANPGASATEVYGDRDILPRDVIAAS